jgi:hypothetical protein
MGTPSSGGGYGGGGYGVTNGPMPGYGGVPQQPSYGGAYGYGTGPQQPAYGMGTGGQYSPQLRQAQTAWQQQAGYGGGVPGAMPYDPNYAGTYGGGKQQMPQLPPPGLNADALKAAGMDENGRIQGYGNAMGVDYDAQAQQQYDKYAAANGLPTYSSVMDPYRAQQQANWQATVRPTPMMPASGGNPWMQQPMRQPYGMGAQGMGNAYGYGGQQGNPWAQLLGMMGGQQQGSTSLSPISQPQAPLQAPPPPPPAAPPPTSFSGLNSLPRGAYQIPGYGGGAPSAAPPPAAPSRPNYSPNNPFGGLYSNPQADAWEQQQRGGSPAPAPTPAAPGTDVMRKALAASVPNQGTNPGYGYGTPGGYQLDTAPSTLDPGSMTGLLSILGGNVNGRNWQGQAADYATWYQNTYGKQAPGGATAYWTT